MSDREKPDPSALGETNVGVDLPPPPGTPSTRVSVDFGIDLGTTNSAVAVLDGTAAEVIKNNENAEFTPSAVWIDKKGTLFVGRRAKERIESDPDNSVAEFKLQMGSRGQHKTFARSGRVMEPEELSAEVLKSLRADVRQRLGEDLVAAAITVPAAFELNQCEATKKAAELAGLRFTPLLQEPTAAALAYGFQSDSDKVFWLVYDFGGGTFDAAVVSVRDGEFLPVNHHGDNFLGGKLIDWAIVEQLLIPAVTAEYPLPGLARGNAAYAAALAKLKLAAEAGKIALSRAASTEIHIEFLCADDRGDPVEFEFELTRGEVERLAEPFILRSINLCRKALAERRLGTADIEKVLFVGGPTLSPYLRERVADPDEGLGIPVDFSQDPMTVVARGAAIFAGAQPLEQVAPAPPSAGQFTVELSGYRAVGPDTEPFIGGVVRSADVDLTDHTVEFVNSEARPPWRSGALPLGAEGTFTTMLWAEKGRPNRFAIELRDPTGSPCQVAPDHVTYTVGLIESAPPLTHSIGVGLANNEVLWLLEKGVSLPAQQREDLRTTIDVRRGEAGGVIRIPVLEGEHSRADRNRRIGTLEVTATDVKRDVPAGSEVEVTITIDESRLVRARAFVYLLDEEFENPIDLSTEAVPEAAVLRNDTERERARLDELTDQARSVGDSTAIGLLDEIEAEGTVDQLGHLVDAAEVDPDAAATGGKRVLDLRASLDEVEAALQWPALVEEAEGLQEAARAVVEAKGTAEDRRNLERYEEDLREALDTHDPALLERRVSELRGLAARILDRTGEMQVVFFESLKEQQHEMRDPARAARLIDEGERAKATGNVSGLRNVNMQLRDLLPSPPPPPDAFSSVIKG